MKLKRRFDFSRYSSQVPFVPLDGLDGRRGRHGVHPHLQGALHHRRGRRLLCHHPALLDLPHHGQ
jgi:hypothetical protein